MPDLTLYLADAVAVAILVFGLYFPRHRRRDLVAAFLGVNVGVMAVASILMNASIGAGLGLGLFGVLSIIRLRSDELAQHEIAYYFSALAIGLLAGIPVTPVWLPIGLMGLVVAAMFVADHPALLRGYRRQVIVLDHAIADDAELRAALEARLGASVKGHTVMRLDLVNDSTMVDVRYRVSDPRPVDAPAAPAVERETVGADR